MPELTRNDFDFLVHSNDPQRDEQQIDDFLEVVNRNYLEVFSDYGTDTIFTVDYITMRAITKGANNKITSTLKMMENWINTNNNDENYKDYHVYQILGDLQQASGGNLQSYIGNLRKIIKYGEAHPDLRLNQWQWNIIYYAGFRNGGLIK